MSVLKISRGPQYSPARVAVYGTEGIGKTTLASQFPNPLILDTEDGSKRLDVARVAVDEWKTLTLAVAELAVQPQGFKTVVIDSADWAERLCGERLCKDHGKKSLEDWSYGKGYTLLAEQFSQFLVSCEKLIDAGLHVVWVAHAQVKRCSPPDMNEGYDRYELKLSKQTAPLLREWADCLLFANYKTKLVDGKDGKVKAVGGRERVMFTERTAAFDAKNRYGLQPELPLTIEALSPLFDGTPAAPKNRTIRGQIAEASTVAELGELGDKVDRLESEGKLTPEQAENARGMIAARHNELEPVAEVA